MGVMDRNKLMVIMAFTAALRFGDAFGKMIKKYKNPLLLILGFILGVWMELMFNIVGGAL